VVDARPSTRQPSDTVRWLTNNSDPLPTFEDSGVERQVTEALLSPTPESWLAPVRPLLPLPATRKRSFATSGFPLAECRALGIAAMSRATNTTPRV
jgi:hypothetical protein